LLFERVDIGEIFGSAALAFVSQECLSSKEGDLQMLDGLHDPGFPSFVEVNPADLGQEIDAPGWKANLIDDPAPTIRKAAPSEWRRASMSRKSWFSGSLLGRPGQSGFRSE
jgi:hypothetical protein